MHIGLLTLSVIVLVGYYFFTIHFYNTEFRDAISTASSTPPAAHATKPAHGRKPAQASKAIPKAHENSQD